MRIGAGRWKHAELPRASAHVRPVPGRLRTSLFSVLASRVEGALVLDLCAGVGGLGLEAASRGAARAVLVERDRRVADALRAWVAGRRASDVVLVVAADALRGGWPPGPYDLVFLDPPFSAWDTEAGVRAFLEAGIAATAPGGLLVVKRPARSAVPLGAGWALVDDRGQGTVAYALLAPRSGPPRGHTPGDAPTGD
jgi:16S rRNA (guanine(966)-N(2))-methyltransferase RsmD